MVPSTRLGKEGGTRNGARETAIYPPTRVNKLTPYGGKTTKIFLENRIEVFLTFQETGLKHPINNLYLKTTRAHEFHTT